jgi:hypothetical protein
VQGIGVVWSAECDLHSVIHIRITEDVTVLHSMQKMLCLLLKDNRVDEIVVDEIFLQYSEERIFIFFVFGESRQLLLRVAENLRSLLESEFLNHTAFVAKSLACKLVGVFWKPNCFSLLWATCGRL